MRRRAQPHSSLSPEMDTASERRLIARFQAGEPEAMNALFLLHVDRVYAYACRLLGSREDAEEIATEAFVRAFEKAASYRGESAFRGWLFGITRHLCLDRLRQPRLILLESEALGHLGETDDGGVNPERIGTRALVQEALTQLSEDQRTVLLLCDVEEWDAREVAVKLEKSLEATKSLLYRARRSLRAQIQAMMTEPEDAAPGPRSTEEKDHYEM